MKNVVIYARYSSAGQSEQSIEGQLRVCHEFASRSGFVVLDEYIDRATTGTNDNRPAFQQMLEDAKKKEFEAIIVYKLDRFARNQHDSVVHKFNLKKLGVRVISSTEIISDSAEGRLLESILESMAEIYSTDLSQKVRRGIKESIRKGNFIGGHILYGYKVVDKKVVIDETQAQAVRYLFEQYAAGMPKKKIVQELNAKGLRNWSGKPFTINSFQHCLTNRKYLGEFIRHEIESTCYPAIIDELTFNRVQEVLSHNKRKPATQKAKVNYLLTGKAFCGICGGSMVGVAGTSKTKGKRHHYYACTNRWYKKNSCKKKHAKKDDLETFVFYDALKFINEPDQLFAIAEHILQAYKQSFGGKQIKEFERQLARVDTELDKCFGMILSADIDEIKRRAESKAKDLEIQKRDLKRELSKLKAVQSLKYETPEDIIQSIQLAFGGYETYTNEEKKRVINTFIVKVVCYDDRTEVVIDPDGYADKLTNIDWLAEVENIDCNDLTPNTELCYTNSNITSGVSNNGVLILSTPLRQSFKD